MSGQPRDLGAGAWYFQSPLWQTNSLLAVAGAIQAAIVALLDELQLDGLALLFITHNLALVNSIADRALVLEAGEVREHRDVADVIEHPAHAYTRELPAVAPELRAAG